MSDWQFPTDSVCPPPLDEEEEDNEQNKDYRRIWRLAVSFSLPDLI